MLEVLGNLLELQEDDQLAALVKDWDFKRGKDFEAVIHLRCWSSVHHPSSSPCGAFHLLAVFWRYTFHLTEASASLALHAVLGGSPAVFHVTCIRDRHFWFSVASKLVGFSICELKRIITNQFDVYFHLWRDGGANWFKEWNKWREEESASWQQVHRRKRHSLSSTHVSFTAKLFTTLLLRYQFLKKPFSLEIFPVSSINRWNPHRAVLKVQILSVLKVPFLSTLFLTCLKVSSPRLNKSIVAQSSNSKCPEGAIPVNVIFDRLKSQLPKAKQVNRPSIVAERHDDPKAVEWRCDQLWCPTLK
jgi:hypothetical protein